MLRYRAELWLLAVTLLVGLSTVAVPGAAQAAVSGPCENVVNQLNSVKDVALSLNVALVIFRGPEVVSGIQQAEGNPHFCRMRATGVPLPTLVSPCSRRFYKRRKQRDTSNLFSSVALDLTFLRRTRRDIGRNVKSATLGG